MYLSAITKNIKLKHLKSMLSRIHILIHVLISFTLANPSRDAINNPPITILKDLVPFCNKKSISFCIRKGAMCHSTLYLNNID